MVKRIVAIIIFIGIAIIVACNRDTIVREDLAPNNELLSDCDGGTPLDATDDTGDSSTGFSGDDSGPDATCVNTPLWATFLWGPGTTPPTYRHRVNALVFGDSLLQETIELYWWPDAQTNIYSPFMLETLRSEIGTDIQFNNVAHGGYTSSQIRAVVPGADTAYWDSTMPNLALVEASGNNDLGRAWYAGTDAKIDNIVDQVLGTCDDLHNVNGHRWTVILLSPPMSVAYLTKDDAGTVSHEPYDHYLARLHSEALQHCDAVAWIDSDERLNADAMYWDGGVRPQGGLGQYSAEGIHPSPNGYAAWAKDVAPTVRNVANSLPSSGIMGSPYCRPIQDNCCFPGQPGCP